MKGKEGEKEREREREREGNKMDEIFDYTR